MDPEMFSVVKRLEAIELQLRRRTMPYDPANSASLDMGEAIKRAACDMLAAISATIVEE